MERDLHHDPNLNILIMLIASVVIGYYLTMTVLLRSNTTDNRNKMYQALLMGFWMATIELVMIGAMTLWKPYYTMLLLLFLIVIVILTLFIYYQIGINEKEYLLSMKEHHQMAVDMSKLVETTDSRATKLKNNIIDSQTKEIEVIDNILTSHTD